LVVQKGNLALTSLSSALVWSIRDTRFDCDRAGIEFPEDSIFGI
jgi:hypothetical protein